MQIYQTNRTLLFKRVNVKKNNLIDYINNELIVDDYLMKEICEHLLVYSFDDFISGFSPHLTIGVNYDTLNIKVYDYDCEIAENTYEELYEVGIRSREQFENLLFCHNDSEQLLYSYQNIIDDFLGADKVADMLEEFTEMMRGNRFHGEKDLNEQFSHFINKWDDGIILIQCMRYLALKRKNSMHVGYVTDRNVILGHPQVKILSSAAKNGSAISNKRLEAFKDIALNGYHGKNTLLWEWWIELQSIDEEYKNEINTFDICLRIYENIIKALNNKIDAYFCMMLNVYSFFRIYDQTEGEMPPGLLIANLNITELDNGCFKKLDVFLKNCNEKNDFANMIWYSIVSMQLSTLKAGTNRMRFSGHRDFLISGATAEEYKVFLDLLAKYKIQVFISIEHGERGRSRNDYATELSEKYLEFEKVTSEKNAMFLYPCVPNLLVLPREDARYTINQTKKTFFFEGLYIQASYVAAGVISACQDSLFLKKIFGEEVISNAPGIRMCNSADLKVVCNECAKRIPRIGWRVGRDEIEKVKDYAKGIVFFSETNNTEIMIGQSMAGNLRNKCLFDEIQTMTYVERIIRQSTKDYELSAIHSFFMLKKEGIYYKWLIEDKKRNSIFQTGEKVEGIVRENSLILTFLFKTKSNEISVNIKR